MFPFGRLGQDKTTTKTSRPVAPPLGRWVESESPELVLMEEEEESSSRKKRRQQSVFLGVFPPKLGHCSCGKRSRSINTKRVKRVIVDESTAEEDSEEADEEEDELVVVPFTAAAAAAAVGVGSDEGGSATEEDQQDEDYSPPKPSRMIYAVRDSQPVDLNPSPQLERSPSLVASTSSSDDDDEASLIQRALTIATETMSESDSQPRPLQATCHHDKTKSDRPKMLCTTDSCNTQWCKRCIEKHYTDTPFLLGGSFLCPLCRDVCSCAACRRKRANGGVRPSMAPRTRVVGVKVLPSRKGKEKEEVQVVEKRRRASTVWDASDGEEYGEEGSEEEDEEEEEEKSEEEYRAAGGSAERNRIRRKRLGGSERRRSRRVSTGGERGESTSASASTSRRLPTRTTRRAIQVEKESLEMSISTSLQDGGEGALFPWLSKESWKAGLEGSDAELELEESSEEEEMDVEVEEEPVKSMWSSAGGLFGDVGVGAGGGGAEPTLAFASTTTQEEDAAIILSPPIDSHHTSTDLDHVLASLTSPPSMTLDPTPQPAILAPVARAPPLGSGQHSRNKVVWREGPARRKRRLEGSLGGGVGGDSQSPMSDPQSPEVETGSHPPGIARRTSNGSNGSLGAPPPYSSRDELQAPKPQPIATSSSSAPSTSFQPHARSATAPPVVDANLAPAFVWSPPQPQPPPQAQHYYPSQHQQQFPQYPTFPHVPPPRPASSLSNYDPRTPISGVRRTGSAPTTVHQHQHHPRYSHPHPPPHPHSQHFPSPAHAHDYHTSFTHHSSLTSTPSQSPQLLAPPSLPHPTATATATYFLPPTSLSSTSDAQLASFMRAAAGGGMHGAMALNAWSQSVFMSAVAERLGSAGAGGERERAVEEREGERVGGVGVGVGRSPWKEVGGEGGGEFVGVGGGVEEKEALGMGMGVGVEQLGGAGESSAMAMDETTWATGWSEVGSPAMGAGMGMGLELMEQSSAGWSAFA